MYKKLGYVMLRLISGFRFVFVWSITLVMQILYLKKAKNDLAIYTDVFINNLHMGLVYKVLVKFKHITRLLLFAAEIT
ncbi:hypothetical protein SHPE106448_17645 [Shewanella pealeana]